jgi:hypothetical protein
MKYQYVMKNKITLLVLTSLFSISTSFAAQGCETALDLENEMNEKTNANVILEATSILMGSNLDLDSDGENSDEIKLPKNVNNSSRL